MRFLLLFTATAGASGSPAEEYTQSAATARAMSAAESNEESILYNPFGDVTSKGKTLTYVSWAYKNGITKGTGETTFSPNAPCTRLQLVTFLYKFNKK